MKPVKTFKPSNGLSAMRVPGGLLFALSNYGGDRGISHALQHVPCSEEDAAKFMQENT
jgi:hypothetical protein